MASLVRISVSSFCTRSGDFAKIGGSSHDWLRRQAKDPFVAQARDAKYRARSAFKLAQIDDKHKILKPGSVVVDCGAAPGSWCQVAAERTNANGQKPNKPRGKVIAVDLQAIYPIDGVTIVAPADFTCSEVRDKIKSIAGSTIDVVLSDMSPRASGTKKLDQEASLSLCRSALSFAVEVLRCGEGAFVCKMLTGGETPRFFQIVRDAFEVASFVKPDASRTDSSEIFIYARKKR